MSSSIITSTNYLVPIDGKTHCVSYALNIVTGEPIEIDWSQVSDQYGAFNPQAAYVDNTQGSASLVLSIRGVSGTFAVPAGYQGWLNFISPALNVMTISGLGSASINFVDFPAPFGGLFDSDGNPVQGDVTVVGALPAGSNNIGSVDVASLPALVAGTNTIGNVGIVSQAATLVSAAASASGSTTLGTPPANSNLRKLLLSVSENAAQATAGENQITVELNGAAVFSEAVYIPATAMTNNGVLYQRDIDFSMVAFNTGSSGTLTISLGSALTSGSVYVNAYFD
jgi:hypothetical protein